MDPQELPIQETTDNIEEALMRATKFSDKPLVIMGSFYLAGEVLLLLEG
jgi:folylpolyglutamate synthase/dihydropteroate synthase